MKKYIVHPGDTMWSISQATGVRMNLLMAANPQIQDPEALRPGTIVAIPQLYKSAAKYGQEKLQSQKIQQHAKASSGRRRQQPYMGYVMEHQVAPSETWNGIATKYGITVEQLHSINGTDGKPLRPGKTLYVPMVAGSPPPSQTNSTGDFALPHGKSTPYPKPTGAAGAEFSPIPGGVTEDIPPVSFSGGPTGPNQHYPFRSTGDALLDNAWESDDAND